MAQSWNSPTSMYIIIMDLLRRKCFLCRPANFSSVDETHCWLEDSQGVFQTPITLTVLFPLCGTDWRIRNYQRCPSYRIFALLRRWSDFLWGGTGKNLVCWYQGHGRLHTTNESWSVEQTIWPKHNVYLGGGSIRPGNNLSIDPLCIPLCMMCQTWPRWYGSNRILFVAFLLSLWPIASEAIQCGGDIPLNFFLCRGCPFGLEKNILYTMLNRLINECSVGLYLILMVTYRIWQWNGSWNHLKFTEVRAHEYSQYGISFFVPKGFYFPPVAEWYYRYGMASSCLGNAIC